MTTAPRFMCNSAGKLGRFPVDGAGRSYGADDVRLALARCFFSLQISTRTKIPPRIHNRHTGSQPTPMARLSGLQREVLSLYRKCLREIRKKPMVSSEQTTKRTLLILSFALNRSQEGTLSHMLGASLSARISIQWIFLAEI